MAEPVTRDAADITNLLKAWGRGDAQALERLTPLVYDQLLRLARRQMRTERESHTLQSTALVHEAYLRLVQAADVDWKDRVHFFAVAAQMMRRILVTPHARGPPRNEAADRRRVDHADASALEGLPAFSTERAADICALDDALASLAENRSEACAASSSSVFRRPDDRRDRRSDEHLAADRDARLEFRARRGSMRELRPS